MAAVEKSFEKGTPPIQNAACTMTTEQLHTKIRAALNYDDEDSASSVSAGASSKQGGEGEDEDSGAIFPESSSVVGSEKESVMTKGASDADQKMCKGFNAVFYVRLLVLLCFLVVSVLAPLFIFRTASNNEKVAFQAGFDALATKVIDSTRFNVGRNLGAIDSLDISLTSYVKGRPGATTQQISHPFVTMPDFDLNAANTLALADTFSVFLAPLVSNEQRLEWEEYSQENKGWIDIALKRKYVASTERKLLPSSSSRSSNSSSVAESVFHIGDTGDRVAEDPGVGPFFPIWQHDPIFSGLVNFNLLSVETLRAGIWAMLNSQQAVLGKVAKFSESQQAIQDYFDNLVAAPQDGDNDEDENDKDKRISEPMSLLFYPIFDTFGSNRTLVSMFALSVYWHTFFEKILPSNAKGIICVVKNSCGQAFTYQINGLETDFKGDGDVHDGSFETFARPYAINPAHNSSLNQDFCPYSLTVYPSKELEEEYITYRPEIYSIVVAFAFILISAVAISYDCIVQQRLKAVIASAVESRAIVSSLFPARFQERLFQNEDDQNKAPQNDQTFGETFAQMTKNTDQVMHPAKLRLKSFLNETPKDKQADISLLQTKPIADLFPHCTVLFADIAGFTAWSSEREPAQVFTLLQTIFHYFDNIARKWGVFKVETIGDCYVAVTGLPDPQPDHAARMAKFARQCLRTFTELTHQLETSLGPDTGDLTMRIGLHSGPVTAGVLRGEKSRFQLFGETVNTASRMESAGRKDTIHISQTTADLLMEANKSKWLMRREDLVSIKGKGHIQTFWLIHRDHGARDSVILDGSGNHAVELALQSVQSSLKDRSSESIPLSIQDHQANSQNRKAKRLIDWQTEILARLLQSIVAQRDRKTAAKFVTDPSKVLKVGGCVLDEVAEVLVLPKFDEKATKVDAKSVDLSPAVISQLRDYVTIIASKYQDNPFHNFEHASHVTMSASKLLSRIVVPEDVNYQRDNKKAIASDLHDYTYGITSDPLTQFAAIFCALIHDVDHRGVSNLQLGIELPQMARKYKNRSLAEQNSVDVAWDLLLQPDFRNLQQCIFATEVELKRFRQLIVNLVMATDIFDKEMKNLRDLRWDRAFYQELDTSLHRAEEEETFNLKSTIVIEHIIQASDVAHTMQHWHVYTKWNERLFQEMYLAYENGRGAKDPSEGWYKGELWFFDNYVIPLGKKLDECNVFGVASDEGLNYALANRAEWQVKGEEIVRGWLKLSKGTKSANQCGSYK